MHLYVGHVLNVAGTEGFMRSRKEVITPTGEDSSRGQM